ncbi:sensor histidine kinase [Geomicrobium sp. JCM 19037]|uniref:sensor histidine kinase n=1 Tax=unclassified Geomicrobium TaxID=2628951 RepID=UPI00045F189F|nr:HAMP domain-containing sensor histidine kinase [Geomicrobium sp. JCM 19037]GAK05611.1 sensor histidine kinase [Geomicrobium sp. JCM 19037]
MLILFFRRSFHARIVTMFIVVLLISLCAAYMFTYVFYPEHHRSEQSLSTVEDGINALLLSEEAASIADLEANAREHQATLTVLDEEQQLQYRSEAAQPISDASINNFSSLSEGESSFVFKGTEELFEIAIARPINGELHTLVYQVDLSAESQAVRDIIIASLLVVFIVGSILFLIASTPIVSPINLLSKAAKKMATGDFSVYIQKKREDEIGELVDNFNYMSKELQKVENMRQEFVSNVSHEFKAPMTTINGFTQAIRDGVVKENEREEYLAIIQSSTQRLSRLSDHLLQLASLESEHHPLQMTSYALDEQIRRVILSTRLLWEEKHIDIQVELPSITIEADQDLMEQVWMNLFTNAIKFSHSHGTIWVNVIVLPQQIKLVIEDEGIGIAEEHLSYVFDRFYTVDEARTPEKSGNGLGLPLVQRIVDAHGFSINVQSKINEGSTFTVTIMPSISYD